MTITAKVIADSVGARAPRLTTFELRYPRFIHAEFMTHRMFSRNAGSSRAIPVEKQIQAIIEDPAMPVHWGKNQKGMQADEENDSLVNYICHDDPHGWDSPHARRSDSPQKAWLEALGRAIGIAKALQEAGYHKQIVNRILEPFNHIKVICTATNYDNFYALRRHKDAQPEIKVLADVMWEAHQMSTPEMLAPGQWHLPYITDQQRKYLDSAENLQYDDRPLTQAELLKTSVARCARVSYQTFDGRPTTIEEDLKLYAQLVESSPLHASPAEHQAKVAEPWDGDLSGNFDAGWIQYRKMLEGECVNTGEYA